MPAVAIECPEASTEARTGMVPKVRPVEESRKATLPVGELAVLSVLTVRNNVTLSPAANELRLAVKLAEVGACAIVTSVPAELLPPNVASPL
jgi:hypothetical protein